MRYTRYLSLLQVSALVALVALLIGLSVRDIQSIRIVNLPLVSTQRSVVLLSPAGKDAAMMPPVADFDATPFSGEAPFTLVFQNFSSGDIFSCAWNYGDGRTGTTCAPFHAHTFQNPGDYTVQLTVSGPEGSDTNTRVNYIHVSTAPSSIVPILSIPERMLPTTDLTATVPLIFRANGNTVSSLLFSIDYDQTSLSFDPTDANNDGLPDAIQFSTGLPASYIKQLVSFAPSDTTGELDFLVADFSSNPQSMTDGVVLTITLQYSPTLIDWVEAPIRFAEASFGNTSGDIEGTGDDGSILILPPIPTPSIFTVNLPVIQMAQIPESIPGRWSLKSIGVMLQAPPAASDPTSHVWDARGSEHVFYRGTDNQIHELWWHDNAWEHRAIAQLASAPEASGAPTSHVWDSRGSEHVFYRGTDNQIHELWWHDNAWEHRAIGQLAGAPPAAGDPTSHVWDTRGSEHVFYRGADNQIHELWWHDNIWEHRAIGQLAGAPQASGNPISHVWDSRGSEHVFYRGADDQIHELWWHDNVWQHRAIGQQVSAPLASDDPTSHVWDSRGSEHVFYRGADDQIHELWWRDNVWQHRAIGQQVGAPLASGDPTSHVWDSRGSEHVFYRGADNQIHELWWQTGSTASSSGSD